MVKQIQCIIVPHEWSGALFSVILKASLEVSVDFYVSSKVPFTSQDKTAKLLGLPYAGSDFLQ